MLRGAGAVILRQNSATSRRTLCAAPKKPDKKKADPVQDAIREAAAQNAPLFGFSSLTLSSPLLWAAAAAVCVIHFASEHFAERPAPEAEVARNDTARALENYRAQRRDQPPREGAA